MRLLFITALFLTHFASAQKISVRGVLQDSLGRPLPSATVLLLSTADSSLVNFAPSGTNGVFEIRGVARQPYLLRVTYVGFATHSQRVEPASGEVTDLGVIVLAEQSQKLDEVTVSAPLSPVIIRKDTIEYNAGSFRTAENALVEDLLKKLPGVEVDNDGTVRAQGKQVQRVTVDGKNFFGTDPKLATSNLPADAVSKVQVYDRKSDQAAFTGIDDGEREKTINLELKEEKRKGAFGQLTAGVGNDGRFQGRASINRFRKTNQLSFLGMANNVNEQGFGIDDYMNFTGNSQAMMSGRGAVRIELSSDNQNGVPLNFGNRANGLMTSYAGGVNMNRDLSKETEIGASYFYNHLDHNTNSDLDRESFFQNGRINYIQQARQQNENDNHRVNFQAEHRIDSMNSLKFVASVLFNETFAGESSSGETTNANGQALAASDRTTLSEGTNTRLSASMLWRHKFARKGRTLSANLRFNGSGNGRETDMDSRITEGSIENRYLQRSTQDVVNRLASGTFTYTEPLGNRRYIEAMYAYRINSNSFERNVFDLLQEEQIRNDSVSSSYASTFEYHRAGLNFRINRKNFNLTAGAAFQSAELRGLLKASDTHIGKSFQSILPSLRFNSSFGSNSELRLDYETEVDEPGIQELQPVVDNSDPLNLYIGNPQLRPAYEHSLRATYNIFNPMTFVNFFALLESSYTRDAISVSQSIDSRGVRLSRPVNVRDNRNLNANLSFGFPIEKLKSRVNVSSSLVLQNGVTVIDDSENQTRESRIGGRVRYDLTLGEIFDLGLTAEIARQMAVFELTSQVDQLYYNNTYSADLNLKLSKKYALQSAFEYLDYRNKASSFFRSLPLLNISISRYLLKANAGELKLGVVNMLDRNLGVSQSVGLNYIERRETNTLGRYIMVSFNYALNRQLNPTGMRPRGRMVRIMR